MACNIMRSLSGTVFEPHIRPDQTLPFVCRKDVTCGQRISNFHENLELLYFLQGSGQVQYGAELYNVQPGDLIVVNAWAVHQVISTEPMTYYCLIIDNAFCKFHDIDVTTLQFAQKIRDERFEPLLRQALCKKSNTQPFSRTAAKLAVLELLLLLCRGYSVPRKTPTLTDDSARKHVQSALIYIRNNISGDLTADTVAQAVGLSKYHFMRLFKRFTGYTLSAYINAIRCEYAKELLQANRHKVKEVAQLCGFESEAYFSNVFKKHTGICPSAYTSASAAAAQC